MDKIKCLVFDVDGVLTDGSLNYTVDGEYIKRFNVKDGFGLTLAKEAGFILCLITARNSQIAKKRGEELKFDEIYIGQRNKLDALDEICQKYNLNYDQIAYTGDDIIDLSVLKKVGFSSCPADAVDDVKDNVHYIAKLNGGFGAVREIITHILKKQNRFLDVTSKYM